MTANKIAAGDFLLTMSPTPYELRWRATGPEPFELMHVYLSLPLFQRASKDAWGEAAGARPLREISGQNDPVLSMLLEQLRAELTARHQPSALFVQGIAQSLAAYLVRTYTDTQASQRHLQKEEMIVAGWIDEDGNLADATFKTPQQGAATQVWAATSPQLEGMGGVYCEDCDIAEPAPSDITSSVGVRDHATDSEQAARLWALSAELTGVNAFAAV